MPGACASTDKGAIPLSSLSAAREQPRSTWGGEQLKESGEQVGGTHLDDLGGEGAVREALQEVDAHLGPRHHRLRVQVQHCRDQAAVVRLCGVGGGG